MTTSNKEKTSNSLVKLISTAALITSTLLAGNVSADELNKTQQVTATKVQNQLMDWSKKMTASLNRKMDSKLEEIIIQAENTRILEETTRNMIATLDMDIK